MTEISGIRCDNCNRIIVFEDGILPEFSFWTKDDYDLDYCKICSDYKNQETTDNLTLDETQKIIQYITNDVKE